MLPRATAVSPRPDFVLEVTFSNGEVGRFDCKPFLGFGVFQALADQAYFIQVRIEHGTVVWPDMQDICPDTLYLDAVRAPAA